MPQFAHLHVHTQFSLLDGAAGIKQLTAQAKADGQSALAITDHGNMFGVPQFVLEAQKQNIKPIIGCEFYVAPGSRFDRTKADPEKERGFYHQVILAKNEIGYKNISKLSSLGFTEGFYYKPRIDKELLQKYSEGLIATTCCLASEVNQSILMRGEEEAEKVFKLYLDIFGEDYYIELQRHGIDDQEKCNEVLLRWAKKYNVKTIATNDVHYVNIQDAQAQDILLCLQTGKDFDDPNRMRFENNQFFLKSQDQINEVFKDVPEAVDNTIEIVSKIEDPKLTRDVLMPNYELPQGFTTEDEYLRDLTMKGAKQWYPEITEEIHKRIDYELGVIKTMGFAGYFLIVQDFVHAAKNQKVWVGPGRGSAAGSIVAFCTGITNIDPIKYNLLFERFLNPERVSMPDIDIDFDDEGRQSVIDYVVDRYGQNRVAQIITFGTMAAKSSIRDVARVLKLPLHESDKLAKLVPEVPGIT
ncbi:MAG: DNA polymerase III subunit alpha, partial [Bacteroidia bacterium]|nr:DNA polymerase III subunit alpha [Bacteroidia bacterium]